MHDPRPRGREDRRLAASTCCASTSTSTSRSTRPTATSSERIGDYDGILIRSAHEARPPTCIEQGRRTCKAIGRAGVGVDNVDVPAATKRGIIVANAPQSNVVTAAEHTLALLLALARNVPQAHASLVAGRVGALEVLAASS